MKRKKAAALKYDKNLNAPVVTAVGFGEIAEKIIAVANDSSIPVVEDSVLADNLTKLTIDQPIPAELYTAVAEIIAYIYSLNR